MVTINFPCCTCEHDRTVIAVFGAGNITRAPPRRLVAEVGGYGAPGGSPRGMPRDTGSRGRALGSFRSLRLSPAIAGRSRAERRAFPASHRARHPYPRA